MTCLQSHGQNKIMRSKQHDLNLGTNNMSINALRLPYFNIFISYIFQLQFPDKWGLKSMKRAFHKRKNASFIMLGKVFWRWSLSYWNTVLSTLVAQASVIQTDVTPSTWKYNFFFPPILCGQVKSSNWCAWWQLFKWQMFMSNSPQWGGDLVFLVGVARQVL